ncbi:iron-containing alcohol dehydrogenase family protein [Halomarina ordinaria]|uniref:Iron-containing alcohol dehydrogenase family protein n=1 Tax=Halomarina ordinaria TaxID=3033939 RepID=A0ABD5U5W7_9EURY|nr:iron-containing alcohol dehydrogenase family protein [Halomarina sp. PSRA2]
MTTPPAPFVFDYDPGAIHFGRDCVAGLGEALADRGAERALVVAGRTVGTTEAVVGPVREGLGDRLAGVFAETTPEKRIETAVEGVAAMREHEADALVALGGGSSLDVATAIRVLAVTGQSLDAIRETGRVDLPAESAPLPPLFAVPTTLAGADLSPIAGVSLPTEEGRTSGGLGRSDLLPEGLFYDPALFETTPRSVLAGSAMNGFDKGLEAVLSRHSTPLTDGTASRGLSLLADALPRMDESAAAMDAAVAGVVCCQYGVSVIDGMKLGVVHAYGHGLRRRAGVQQGLAHAVMVPHVLRDVFATVDGRRDLLATAFGVDDAEGVVSEVERVRDGLDLPSRLRDLDGVERDALDDVARLTREDALFENGPEGYGPSRAAVRETLDDAW